MRNLYHRLASRRPQILDESAHLISSVLLPLVERQGKLHVLFEVRSKNLHRQPGEICFPGGKVEVIDRQDPLLTALRETTEELGIMENDIEVIGPLDILVTHFSALIYPYAGIIKSENIRFNPKEVEEVFLVPMDFFLAEPPYITCVEVGTRYPPDFPLAKVPPIYREGWQMRSSYPMYFYDYEKYFIWGLTCRILHNFLSIGWPDHEVFRKPFKKWR